MSEKVKLPKEVCYALDYVKHQYDYLTILNRSHNGHWMEKSLRTLNDVKSDTLMKALVLGYEPELSVEEQIKELYNDPPVVGYGDIPRLLKEKTYQKGIRDALRIHGIHYDWLDGDAE